LAVVGFTTKRDLSTFGTVMWMGMVGVFVSSLINMVLQNTLMDMIVSGIAIVVFCGLTVYDNQAYKRIYASSRGRGLGKFVVLGALHMYINFIMIFVNLLKFFGSRN
jgi:FtsH-binding integral membrane protein